MRQLECVLGQSS